MDICEKKFKREDTIVVKGLAIIFMLYHHLFAFPDRLEEGVTYVSLKVDFANTAYYIGGFGKICVALFAFLAGYGIFHSCKKNTLLYIYKKRIGGLYIIWWTVLLIFIPMCRMFGGTDFPVDLFTIVKNFTGMVISYNGEAWFLQPYVILIAISPLIYKLDCSIKTNFIIDCVIAVVVNIVSNWGIDFIYDLYRVHTNVSPLFSVLLSLLNIAPEFLWGYLCAKYNVLSGAKSWLLENNYRKSMALPICLLTFLTRLKLGGSWDCLYALLLVVSCVVFLNSSFTKWIYKLLYLIGQQSTVIWLTHSFFCYQLCQRFVFAPKVSILIVVLLLIICYVVSVLINKGLTFVYSQFALWSNKVVKVERC